MFLLFINVLCVCVILGVWGCRYRYRLPLTGTDTGTKCIGFWFCQYKFRYRYYRSQGLHYIIRVDETMRAAARYQ